MVPSDLKVSEAPEYLNREQQEKDRRSGQLWCGPEGLEMTGGLTNPYHESNSELTVRFIHRQLLPSSLRSKIQRLLTQ